MYMPTQDQTLRITFLPQRAQFDLSWNCNFYGPAGLDLEHHVVQDLIRVDARDVCYFSDA